MYTPTVKGTNTIPYILLFALIVVSLPFLPAYQAFGYDREIYKYAGMMVAKGYLPYKDFFDHKPPVFYFISAIAYLLGPWGYPILSFIATYITSIVIFQFARRNFTSYSFILIVPLIYIFISKYDPLYDGGGLTREYTQIFTTLLIFLRTRDQRLRFFLIGLLYSLIFLTQQNEILSVTVIVGYFILWDVTDIKLKRFSNILTHGMSFAAGALVICLLFGCYLYFNNIFNDFLEQAFRFNTNIYIGTSFYQSFSTSWLTFYNIFTNLIIFSILYLFMAPKNKYYIEYLVFFFAMFVQLCATSLGNNFGHYYQSFFPYFTYIVYLALKNFEDKIPINYHRYLAFTAFFICFMPMPLILRLKAITEGKFWSYYAQRDQCYDIVKDIKGKDGQLFVFNNPSYLALNTDLQSVSKSKLLYFHFYSNDKFDSDNRMFLDMVDTLKSNNCKYIIDFSRGNPIGRKKLQEHWEWFVNTNYHVIHEQDGSYRILQVN